jgi:hypothetical protein
MERSQNHPCLSCLKGIHDEHDLNGCTHIVQRFVRDGQEYKEMCSCLKTPFPLQVDDVLKLKLKDPSH